MKKFDLTVIGAGAGGYVAAIHAAKSGLKVAIIEKGKVGGACFNLGCIPSKIMLEHSKVVQKIRESAQWGITVPSIDVDFPKLMSRKERIIQQLLDDIHVFIQNATITFITGEAKVTSDGNITVNGEQIKTDHIILATGSKPFVPPFKGLENAKYHTTDTIFNIRELPKQLTIIGGGVIAVEMAFSLAPLGTKVTILNHSKDILQTEEPEARPIIRQKLHDLGVELVLDFEFQEIRENEVITSRGNYPFEQLLFATGRRPNLEVVSDLNLEMDGHFIKVNDEYQTSIPNIYAIGDIVPGPQLAHKASYEGKVAAEAIAGQKSVVDYLAIPAVCFTDPEMATVGLTEAQAKEEGFEVSAGKFPFAANGRALALNETEGFVKLVARKEDGLLLGAQIIGVGASDMIAELGLAIEAGMTLEDVAMTIHAHPTLGEITMETAEVALGNPIHIIAKK